MADTGVFSTISDIVALFVSFIYQLTVKLAVEFLKFFILLAILIATFGVFGFAYVSFIAWAYITYNSLPAALIAVFLGAVLFVITTLAIQYLVKDVLCLTDQPLSQLAMIYINALTRRKKCSGMQSVSKDPQQGEEQNVVKGEGVQQIKKTT